MPFFYKKESSNENRKKMELKLYLAQSNPSDVFDGSECQLTTIPPSVLECIYLQKKKFLLLHNNFIKSISHVSEEFKSLNFIDLHNNKLTGLTYQLFQLPNLEVLDVSYNQIRQLPKLRDPNFSLKKFNISYNQLSFLSDDISQLEVLSHLDIQCNPINKLPNVLLDLTQLNQLNISFVLIQFPPREICEQGLDKILAFLASNSPNKVSAHLTPRTKNVKSKISQILPDKYNLDTAFEGFHKEQQENHQRLIDLERKLAQDREISVFWNDKKAENDLEILVQNQKEVLQKLCQLNDEHEQNHRRLLDNLTIQEDISERLIAHILSVNDAARQQERIMQEVQDRLLSQERWLVVQQEESDTLRRKEVLEAMGLKLGLDPRSAQDQLEDVNALELAEFLNKRHEKAIFSHFKEENQRQVEFQNLLVEEELLQKKAFWQLQVEKDACLQRLQCEMEMLECQLLSLSRLETESRSQQELLAAEVLAQRRLQAANIYAQLQQERDFRAQELQRLVDEMEAAKEKNQVDYWLIQYQRLLDRKPQSLIDQENKLEKSVLEIINKAEAGHFLKLFQNRKITIETLIQMDDIDLEKIGISDFKIRSKIIHQCKVYRMKPENQKESASSPFSVATAPEDDDRPADFDLHAKNVDTLALTRQLSHKIVQSHLEMVCCICLEANSCILFLPCGHICCCLECNEVAGSDCPLCRAAVDQRINVSPRAPDLPAL